MPAYDIVSTRDMIARRNRLLGPAYRLFYEQPVQFVRGEGVWLYDPEGNPYLDAYNNVASVGHCHPHVVRAIARQASLLNTHTRYLHETVLDYAERLLATFPTEIGHIMFACSGSEANDLALRVARTCTGGTGFIVTETAYHGVTSAMAELSPSLGLRAAKESHVRLVPAPRSAGDDTGENFARQVRDALDDMERHAIRPAGLLVDTIFSSDGVFTDPPGFLRPAVEAGASRRRPVHCRRGASRLRPHRRTNVGLCPSRCRSGSRHHGQTDGKWTSGRRDGGASASPGRSSVRGHATSTPLAAIPSPPQRRSRCWKWSSPKA